MRRRDCQEKYCASPRTFKKNIVGRSDCQEGHPPTRHADVARDFNAKVCCDNKDKKRTMGRHGVDVITNNGERLVNSANRTTWS
ncbi:hypothetical protein DPMN_015868 [Dreissena polymorpha]|uniref:Uncharacterized protein n=1 Tax=Dreissena polymorpha TaxID=45954 RepID=A0A9D4NCB6_DREPO|nr:hypothetical protein DPMN_015868 [Dreissena polymorpha]